MEKYGRVGEVWFSDRFCGGYDNDEKEYYIEDRYVDHKYFRDDWNYHHALITLLNDRQGYINFILETIDNYVEEYGEDERLFVALREEICNYKEIWE